MILDFWFKVVSENGTLFPSLFLGVVVSDKNSQPDGKKICQTKIISKLEGILRTYEEMSLMEYNLPNYCIMNITVCLIKG